MFSKKKETHYDIRIRLDKDTMNRFTKLCKIAGTDDFATVIARALAMYEFAIIERENGNPIMAYNENNQMVPVEIRMGK